MFGRLIERMWKSHPLYPTQSSDRSDVPNCDGGEAFLQSVLEAEVGDVISLNGELLDAVFYSGGGLGSFTGEKEPINPWVMTGANVVEVLVNLEVVSLCDDGSYIKSVVGFGSFVYGPRTWTLALGEWVSDSLE